jgi:DNA replication protein DnaC
MKINSLEDFVNYSPEMFEGVQVKDVPPAIFAFFDTVEKLKELRKGAYIHGGVGVGKTHIAWGVVKHLASLGVPCVCENSCAIAREIKGDFKSEIINELADFRGILFLDDVGTEKWSDFIEESFYHLFNTRYEHRRVTILTSNLPPQRLHEKVGDRIASRILGSSALFVIGGNDRRLP